ncbi:MAG: hypothetical protein M3P18_09675 [Actinomycetota bacterium]|nr:hypothetical protein [Actinomycetota bacterium]
MLQPAFRDARHAAPISNLHGRHGGMKSPVARFAYHMSRVNARHFSQRGQCPCFLPLRVRTSIVDLLVESGDLRHQPDSCQDAEEMLMRAGSKLLPKPLVGPPSPPELGQGKEVGESPISL